MDSDDAANQLVPFIYNAIHVHVHVLVFIIAYSLRL